MKGHFGYLVVVACRNAFAFPNFQGIFRNMLFVFR